VAGCSVQSGKLSRAGLVRVARNGEVLFDGPLVSLKHLKEEASEVEAGKECGLILEDKEIRFQPGDKITSYNVKQVTQETDWSPGF